MATPVHIPWLRRLLLALGAVLATLTLAVVILVIRDAYTPVDPRWSDPSGEPQLIAWFLLVGGFFALASYLLFSVPLVLLWPVHSQLIHWYGPLAASLLWPPVADVLLLHQPLESLLFDIKRSERTLLFAELFAFVACGLYLVLLRGAAQASVQAHPDERSDPFHAHKM